MQCLLACLLIMRASARLPIDGDDPFDAGADCLHPLQKTRFKLFGINESKDSSKRVMGGNPVGQLEQIGEPVLLRFPKFFDSYPSIRSTDHPTNRYDDDITQPMQPSSFNTWIFHLHKNRFKGSQFSFFHPIISCF